MARPKPISKSVVCSECGLPWAKHTAGRKTDPTLDVCVRLLKAELAKPRYPFMQSQLSSASGYGVTFTQGGVQ